LDENLATEAHRHGQELMRFAYIFFFQLFFAELFEKHIVLRNYVLVSKMSWNSFISCILTFLSIQNHSNHYFWASGVNGIYILQCSLRNIGIKRLTVVIQIANAAVASDHR